MKKMLMALVSAFCLAVYAAEHNHEGHDHEGHKHDAHEAHEGHDHGEHKHDAHEDHDHGEHKHCAHEGHDHKGHVHKDHEDHDHEGHSHEGHNHDHGKSVEVAVELQQAMGLKTVHPEKRRMQATVSFTGRFELSPDARRTVASPVAGRLALAVNPLAKVQKGDLLFTVTSPDLVARANEIAVLEKRLAVYRNLKTANAQLESDLAVKKAERAALLANAEEKDGVVSVRAASAGLAETFTVQDGAWVETGASVLGLVRPEALRFKALVAASDAVRLSDGLKAIVRGQEGHVRLGVGDESGLLPAYVLFDGTVKARAGERDTAACVTDETEVPVLAVPTTCLVKIGLQPHVFVKDEHDPDRFVATPVTPGLANGGWTAVAGLPDDDDLEIVSAGAYELKLALPATGSKPAGHFHADGTFHETDD